PSSRPVQQWFGEYIHGVMDEAFRYYRASVAAGTPHLPPWGYATTRSIRDLVKERLAAKGLFPWNPNVERIGDLRAHVCLNQLGPFLLPTIEHAEVQVTGSRDLPPIARPFRVADRYEVKGVIDVVTNVQLSDPSLRTNPVIQAILPTLPATLP